MGFCRHYTIIDLVSSSLRFVFSQDALIDVAVGLGAPLNKLILNMPAFGNSFNLMDQDKNLPGSSVTGLPQTTTYQQVTITTVILLDNQPRFLNPFLPCFCSTCPTSSITLGVHTSDTGQLDAGARGGPNWTICIPWVQVDRL